MTNEKHIISWCTIRPNSVYKDGQLLFEQDGSSLREFLLEVYQLLNKDYPKFYKMDQLSKLGWLAAELLLRDIQLPEDTGIVLSNANSSLDTDLKYQETTSDIPSPGVFVYTLPNIMIGEISIRFKFKGENAFFISDRFDPALLEMYVGSLLETGAAGACLCGWVDVLGEDFRATLFLVAKTTTNLLFTSANMDKIFTW